MNIFSRRTVYWFEPRSSGCDRPPSTEGLWSIPGRDLLRLLIVALVTFAVASVVLFTLLPIVFSKIFYACIIAFVVCLGAVFLFLLLGRIIVGVLVRVVPRSVHVSRYWIVIQDRPSNKAIRIKMSSLVSLSMNDHDPTRKTIAIKWQDGEITLGVPSGLDLALLRRLVGEKFHTANAPNPQEKGGSSNC